MSAFSHILDRHRQWMLNISIFNRVLIGNSFIIIFGAVAGTYFTQRLALLGSIELILLFSFVGILITLFVNYWIIKSALQPLHELSKSLEKIENEQFNIPNSLKKYKDPDINRLITAIESVLMRLKNRTDQLRAISERAINVQEEERVRIARGLHDDTSQSISILLIHLEQMEKALPADAAVLSRHVSESHQLATQLLENLRKIIWNLRPSILDDLGLIPAIRWFARTNLEEVGVEVDFGELTEINRLPPHLETMLFRITQEAVSNILRHADASKVAIGLHKKDGQLWLEIRDDGRGFDVERTAEEALSRKRLGLLGIQERASLAGGVASIESMPGAGTVLRVEIPMLDEFSNEESAATL